MVWYFYLLKNFPQFVVIHTVKDFGVVNKVKMDTIKDRNGMDLTEAEDIKKRWQEHTEDLYKKIFMTQITTMVWSLT